uniref:Reverse transcriptase Ty1/copia-type domain-containing protein n=1 Tax=Chromera velia CCMP2878 TaxID=1169474 RepID=A0A0G4FTX5_9ALVE|eukprot:Cvel_18772.t1-p1 / transcript=Cvel_18772.t1 / gene=Cvel_18772 / organism=Chromera_velia_CCMP2878 / gene_product=Retrovirus-related Pol polyprotein from transposon, putative / transcript_product=Retrovirus-related Pol polyprotein from transposon, putative / location=Cvel_scaffold1575:39682-41355(-) / protein_length=558 / sequence_SO=supercontig / SO=protein_coding / is_pseudo=false
MGDEVRVIDPAGSADPLLKSERALFGGVQGPQVCSLVVLRRGRWVPLRVHPQHVRLEKWLGVDEVQKWREVRKEKKVEEESGGWPRSSVSDDDHESQGVPAVDLRSGGEDVEPDSSFPETEPFQLHDENGNEHPRRQAGRWVLARNTDGALWPGRIVREGAKQERGLKVARFNKDENGKWKPKEIEHHVKQQDIVERFDPPVGGGIPADLLSRLDKSDPPSSSVPLQSAPDVSTESLPSSDHAVVSSDPVPDDVDVMPIDVDPVVEQIQEEVCRTDFLDWKSKGRKEKKAIIFQRKKERRAREEVRKAETLDRYFEVACMALKAEKAKKLMKRENNAKGHIPATPEEIAAGSHVESDKKELARWALCGVFDLSSQTQHPRPGVKPITLRWVRTWKLKEEERVAKSRLVAKGFQDARDNGFLETFSGTASSSLSRAAFVWALSRGLQAAKADISTAFLQAPLDGKNGEVWLRLPSDLPVSVYPGLRPGVCVRILKAVYGLKDSPRVYTQYFKKRVKELGWEEIAESILVKRDKNKKPVGVLVMHVDDLFAFAPDVMKEM